MKNKFVAIAALSGLFTVAFGAIASHALSAQLSIKALGWIDTGIKYQMFHTLAILALGLFQIANSVQNPPACRAKAFNLIGGSWALGILLFSGNLYLLALNIPTIHWFTPIGGLSFMFGWCVLLFVSLRGRNVQ
ncbi:DUF423 domain-containing protein [Mannheimia sp. AT1]|uniref:DUF423 domain-containing protein n=1 Tax=Mannheimia cairinae TaxID=3025936 RepID=A0ABT5MRR1_9PAST|nr:DUF423 domain-containing protein [Mannheimia cairinae]MDD0824860.1 DUF423 domain-containing protein [Mannheimia cairinae]MDD0826210.1 DUF423 domain-containing protein [Mannheimia cairinae]